MSPCCLFILFYFILFFTNPFCVSISNHIVGLVHKNHIIRTCLMYHACCKVEFQPFRRSYSQLTFFNFLYKKRLVLGAVRQAWSAKSLWETPTRWSVLLAVVDLVYTDHGSCRCCATGMVFLSAKPAQARLAAPTTEHAAFIQRNINIPGL